MDKNDDIRLIFGKALADLRNQKNFTQEQLSEYLSLSVHTINRIENGKTFVSAEVITQICELFNISPSVLFTPRPHILYDEYTDYFNEIVKLLPSFKTEKLKEIYNFLVIANK